MHICMAYTCKKISCNIMQHHVTYPHELRDTPLLWPASSGPGGRLLRGGGPPRVGAARAEPLRRDGEASASDAAAVAGDLGRLDVAWMLKGGMWGLGEGFVLFSAFFCFDYIYISIDIHSIFAGLCFGHLGTVHILL